MSIYTFSLLVLSPVFFLFCKLKCFSPVSFTDHWVSYGCSCFSPDPFTSVCILRVERLLLFLLNIVPALEFYFDLISPDVQTSKARQFYLRGTFSAARQFEELSMIRREKEQKKPQQKAKKLSSDSGLFKYQMGN